MAAILALHQALHLPSSLVLVLAPSERQSKELFAKIATFYRALGHAILADSARKLGMELANGSRIEALPGTERTIRGFSGVDLLIVDEAARVDDGLYHAVRPMLAVSGGRLLMLSTPYGKRGVFFEAWSGPEDWQRFEVPASDVPRISEAFLAEERAALPDRVYRTEYTCEFLDTDDAVFGYDLVQAAVTDNVTPLFEEAS
jgi:phage FluMu gp28-like protein